MFFNLKIILKKPLKLPFKSNFNSIYAMNFAFCKLNCRKKCSPKGPLWVRFPPGVPFWPQLLRSFLYNFGKQPQGFIHTPRLEQVYRRPARQAGGERRKDGKFWHVQYVRIQPRRYGKHAYHNRGGMGGCTPPSEAHSPRLGWFYPLRRILFADAYKAGQKICRSFKFYCCKIIIDTKKPRVPRNTRLFC